MVIPDILTQHAEEAAFLWLLRDAAKRVISAASPKKTFEKAHYSLRDQRSATGM